MAGLNQTPAGERVHIAFFGKRNAGKSSLVNAFTGQDLAIVSEVKGTTTDPVYKSMELLPLGPVEIIDTPGIDDTGELGELRVKKTKQVLNKTDLAIVVCDGTSEMDHVEEELLYLIKEKNIPSIIVKNKADLLDKDIDESVVIDGNRAEIWTSAKEGFNIFELKELAAKLAKEEESKKRLIGDLLSPGDIVVLVIPIDKAAPKGRLILPQQQTIRDILEAGASALVCRDEELEITLKNLGKDPKLVVTDSQVFSKVSKIVPEDVPLTSFSILMARYKGDLPLLVKGAKAIDSLLENQKILISEGCTHHRQCDDIGTYKIPKWIEKRTGIKPNYAFTSGTEFPEDLDEYAIIIHCGGCMLREKEVKYRIRSADDQNIPITNYGIFIAYINGILERTLRPFGEIHKILED